MSFDALAAKYALPERPLSESGVRRHFARHVPEPEDSPISGAEASGNGLDFGPTSSATTPGDQLDAAHALLEAGTRMLGEMVQTFSQEYRAAVQERPQAAERAFGKFMKAQTALARCVKQLEDGRTLRDEFRKIVPQSAGRTPVRAATSRAEKRAGTSS